MFIYKVACFACVHMLHLCPEFWNLTFTATAAHPVRSDQFEFLCFVLFFSVPVALGPKEDS